MRLVKGEIVYFGYPGVYGGLEPHTILIEETGVAIARPYEQRQWVAGIDIDTNREGTFFIHKMVEIDN
jgi:hypothetical protein